MLSWHQFKGNALRKCCQQQVAFHQCEVVANTDAGTSSKGYIGQAWKLFLILRCKTCRVEPVGIKENVPLLGRFSTIDSKNLSSNITGSSRGQKEDSRSQLAGLTDPFHWHRSGNLRFCTV